MGKDGNRAIIYLSILVIFIIGSLVIALFVIPSYFKEYARIANLLVWVGLFAVSTQIPNEHTKFKAKTAKIKTTIIIVIVYYIFYTFTGIITGYKVNPYSRQIFKMLENIIMIVGLVALQEYVRARLVNNQKKISLYVIITIAFLVINTDIQALIHAFSNVGEAFKYICSTLLLNLAISGLCTYLAKTGGFQLIFAYIIPAKLAEVLLPVFPDVDWFILTVYNLMLVIILIFYNNYEHAIKTTRMTRRDLRKESPLRIVPTLIVLVIGVGFVAGLFPYKPVAVMSNSMVPIFSRGAIVISKKVNDDYGQIKIGDVIEFKTKKGTMIHRVVYITQDENKNYMFTTKGDANDSNDLEPVRQENVVGVMTYSIEYFGYPSVWFSELVLNKDSII